MFGKSRIDLQLDEQRRSDVIRHNELGNFLGCLNVLSSYDSILNVHLETSKIFRGTSNRIQNDLICSVSNIISTSIESEIKNTNFVALLLDETSDITNLSQLLTTLRYVHHETGEAHERFISFVDVSADRSADGLLKHVIDIVNRYELKHKLVAQTYDGAAVMSGHVGGLQVKVKELYPKALFVHCFI
ncbi:SCAN domain-containing protein 3-like [Melanaphis sacchari]|uniref:SCAN domain-containing protein 3-like n=1 Tax=Melanaphis sacchari TaxID=742174 RepID=UPI000DC1459A|nr:SCAN domain-containing protein 3-like [Melanaphis sacchari]